MLLPYDVPPMAVDRAAVGQYRHMLAVHAAHEVAQVRAFGGYLGPALSRARYRAAGEIAAAHDIDLDDMLAMIDMADREDRAAYRARIGRVALWALSVAATAALVAGVGTLVMMALIGLDAS